MEEKWVESDFLQDSDGVHYMSPIDREFTICGKSWDGECGDDPMTPTKKRTVTCAKCAEFLRACRGIRIAA